MKTLVVATAIGGFAIAGLVAAAQTEAYEATPTVEVASVAPAAAVEPVNPVCEAAAWPYIPAECLTAADGRTVTDVPVIRIETGSVSSAL